MKPICQETFRALQSAVLAALDEEPLAVRKKAARAMLAVRKAKEAV